MTRYTLPIEDPQRYRAQIDRLQQRITAAATHYATLPDVITPQLCNEWEQIVRLIRELERTCELCDEVIARRRLTLRLRRN